MCADDAAQVAAIEAAAEDAGVRLPVLVEIDVGAGRCGVAPGPDAVDAGEAHRRVEAPDIWRTAGLSRQRAAQAHGGGTPHADRQRSGWIARTVEQLRQQGLDCPIVGGAGTGTFQIESVSGVYNEIQAGSYVFMDADYARNLDEAGAPISTFRHSLFVLATVMSVPNRNIAVVDAGHKAVAVDSGMPTIWQRPDIRYVSASDEHGKLEVGSETARAEAWREAAAGAGALRSDGGSLRLVCRGAQRARGVPVADRGAGRDALRPASRSNAHRRLRADRARTAVADATHRPRARSAAVRNGW